ncbi:TatD family hydrolase [Vibrio sp. D404a]|uniref:TatD family hydrolase n=1 Tax=unclassified Vibrio TaxID=2614977 RepID=UPI00255648A8|nr:MULTISPECIES: TatD family hydrolase [unclassified Vibrio]MDK9737891.1 TatD family hydrolase [Vibrio sp. D404a]MDK9798683.1 TatD family hydrolase [Vibrio sp. D449a]
MSIPLFDTHCHLDFDAFSTGTQDDLMAAQNYLTAAQEQGVEKVVVPSIGKNNWNTLEQLSSHHSNLYYALGFHPYFLATANEGDFDQLEHHLSGASKQCIAIGECGLDFFVDVDIDKQERFFVRQIELATAYKLPLIIHERKSHNRLIQLIKQQKFANGGVIHGFSGSEQQALEWIRLGFYIGVGGTITYPRAQKTRTTVSRLPLEWMVLETDAPDMPISGQQGNINHSKYLVTILNELVSLRKEPKQSIATQIWQNSHLLFGICE